LNLVDQLDDLLMCSIDFQQKSSVKESQVAIKRATRD